MVQTLQRLEEIYPTPSPCLWFAERSHAEHIEWQDPTPVSDDDGDADEDMEYAAAHRYETDDEVPQRCRGPIAIPDPGSESGLRAHGGSLLSEAIVFVNAEGVTQTETIGNMVQYKLRYPDLPNQEFQFLIVEEAQMARCLGGKSTPRPQGRVSATFRAQCTSVPLAGSSNSRVQPQ